MRRGRGADAARAGGGAPLPCRGPPRACPGPRKLPGLPGLLATPPPLYPFYLSSSLPHPARCIDTYVEQRVAEAEGHGDAAAPDARLVAIVERLFARCFSDGQYEQAVGVALESRRLDQLEAAITRSAGGWAAGKAVWDAL